MEHFFLAFILIFAVQITFFALAATFKTDKFTDLAYGSTFVLVAIIFYFIYSNRETFQLIITAFITLWGLRLSGYLFFRILKTKTDERFDKIRSDFARFARFWLLQSVAIWIILLPSLVILSSTQVFEFNYLTRIGEIIFIFGLVVEAIADHQKFTFKNKVENKGKWIESGLWKYSRHPNYFGEILVWWGIFIAVVPFLSQIQYLTIISPIFITILLLFVTGIPTLEKKYSQRYKGNRDYQKYTNSTSILIPLPKM